MSLKRSFDLLISAPFLLLLSPLFALVAVCIKLDSRGPVFFRQTRVGTCGRPFRIFKFRTMVADAEQRGAQITASRDPRVTGCGSFLRSSKLDELPQLINVLLGEMTLVGPRPEVPRYVEMYTSEQRSVLELIPGITDPASIRFRNEGRILADAGCAEETYTQAIMPEKIRINLEYARTATIVTDIAVLLRTVGCLFRD